MLVSGVFSANWLLETEAFKYLIYTKLKRNKEALEGIKKVLFKNLANFTCWHVYGLIMRTHK
jgi:hypothetical protein